MPNENLVQLIKKIALDAFTASKPCNVILGRVQKLSPINISVSQKIILDEDFLDITSTAKKNMKEGSRVLMIRQAGGQRYVVIDTLN